VNVRETVDRLIALALDEGAGEHESRNAAMQAVRLINEHKLLDRKMPASKKRSTIPFELTAFDFNAMMQKLYVMDFDGAVAMIQRLKKRTEKVRETVSRNARRDFEEEPVWTEKTQHAARRAGQPEQCAYCGEAIMILMWICNPHRAQHTIHLRCFRELKEKERG
jgi:phage-related protein